MILTHFMALALTETAYMIAVKRVSILLGIVLGAGFFAERHLARNLFAGALTVGGWPSSRAGMRPYAVWVADCADLCDDLRHASASLRLRCGWAQGHAN